MSGTTKIEWTERTWNPITGCSKVSPGCDNCYAETMSNRLSRLPKYAGVAKNGRWTGDVFCQDVLLEEPFSWKEPTVVFVCSMSDLFHSKVPWEFIVKVFDVMAATPWHTYQVLTKRPGRMAYFAEKIWPKQGGYWEPVEWTSPSRARVMDKWPGTAWPSNVWAGTSVESQKYAPRLDCLARVPARIRFVSVEPMLDSVDLRKWLSPRFDHCDEETYDCTGCDGLGPRHEGECGAVVSPPVLSWIIVGGESGPGARPIHPDWARSLRDQCEMAGVPFFFKQWGGYVNAACADVPGSIIRGDQPVYCMKPSGELSEPNRHWSGHQGLHCAHLLKVGKKAAGALLDGREWREMPRAKDGGS